MSSANLLALRYTLEAVQEHWDELPFHWGEVEDLYREMASFVAKYKCARRLNIDPEDFASGVPSDQLWTAAYKLYSEMDSAFQLSFITEISENYTIAEWLGDWDKEEVLEWLLSKVDPYTLMNGIPKNKILDYIQLSYDISDILGNYNGDEMEEAGWVPNKPKSHLEQLHALQDEMGNTALLSSINADFLATHVSQYCTAAELARAGLTLEKPMPKPRVRLHVDGSIEILHLVIPKENVEVVQAENAA